MADRRLRRMMTGKIHRATVTGADLHYVGSVTVDADLLDAADILPGQEVDVVDVTNGARLTTYAIPGDRGSGVLTINRAAAHLVGEGDTVILISYSLLDDASRRLRRRGQSHRRARCRARPGPFRPRLDGYGPALRRRPRVRPRERSGARG